jgi:hypothetical protein
MGFRTEGAHLDGRAFRHGDIAEELVECVKVIAGSLLAKKIAESQRHQQKKKSTKDKAKHPVQTAREKLTADPEGDEDVMFDETDVARCGLPPETFHTS